MKPVKLSTGEVLHPTPITRGTKEIVAMAVALPGDPDYALWRDDSRDATPAEEPKLRKLVKQIRKTG